MRTNEQAFELTRRHTEDADEARCLIGNPNIALRGNIYHFSLTNDGKRIARDVHAHIEFSENKLPGLEPIKVFKTVDISPDELKNEFDMPEDVILQGLGDKEWDEIAHTNEALVMNASIGYENGFGRSNNAKICVAAVVDDRPKVKPTVTYPNCSDLPTYLRRSTFKWFHLGKSPD